jgi:hypothetical protein
MRFCIWDEGLNIEKLVLHSIVTEIHQLTHRTSIHNRVVRACIVTVQNLCSIVRSMMDKERSIKIVNVFVELIAYIVDDGNNLMDKWYIGLQELERHFFKDLYTRS